jgi:DNA-binding transcriptional regulator YdaS (Cro superfamily)
MPSVSISKRARGGKPARRRDPNDPMQRACKRAVASAGGPLALARALSVEGRKITHNAIGNWLVVPAERVLDVERLTGVSRFELRPDVYGDVDLAELAAKRFRRTRGEVAA